MGVILTKSSIEFIPESRFCSQQSKMQAEPRKYDLGVQGMA
jgi:hypothetical protein